MSDVIFMAFANSPQKPLPTLKEEDAKIYELLVPRVKSGDFMVHRDSYATREAVVRHLSDYLEDIIIFQYSGHAEKDQLITEKEAANAEGILSLLAQCPKLKLILLNGCATHAQGELIFSKKLKKSPVVISTSAPIGDRSATLYAISFWERLAKYNTSVQEAHQVALAAVKSTNEAVNGTRGLFSRSEQKGYPSLWDISSRSTTSLLWKLPQKKSTDPEPTNQVLLSYLLKTFSAYDPEVAKVLNDHDISTSYKVKPILEALPLPISEQLRKLFAQQSAIDQGHRFYNRPGKDRLRQMIVAYKTLVETVSFIHLAQLWDLLHEKPLTIDASVRDELKTFFLFNDPFEKNNYSLIQLAYNINKVFTDNELDNFLMEWNQQDPPIEYDTKFNEAIDYMQQLNQDISSFDQAEVLDHSIQSEEQLAIIYSVLAFITNYHMTSVKSIFVNKYRHLSKSEYDHSVINLITKFDTFDRKIEQGNLIADDPQFTDAVIISRKDDPDRFLNLTPFVIDENSFNPKAPLAKICHFSLFEETINKYVFSHVYDREENPLEIDNEQQYKIIKDQFDHFSISVLNREAEL